MRGSQPLSQTNLVKQVEMSIIPYRSVKDQSTMAVGWLGPCLEAFFHVREWGWERKCPKIQNHHHHQKPGQPPFFGYETVDEQNPAPVQKVNNFSLIAGFESSQSNCSPSTGAVFAMVFHLQFICPHWWLHGLTEQLFFATEHKCHANFKGVSKGLNWSGQIPATQNR